MEGKQIEGKMKGRKVIEKRMKGRERRGRYGGDDEGRGIKGMIKRGK